LFEQFDNTIIVQSNGKHEYRNEVYEKDHNDEEENNKDECQEDEDDYEHTAG